MATQTTNYGLKKPAANDFYDVAIQNDNMETIDAAMKDLDNTKEELIKDSIEKTSMVDADALPLIDSADSSKTKKLTFANLKILLKTIFATVEDVSAVNTSLSWEDVLHNTDFVNPINQSGASGTISSLGYFIDRWKLTTGTVTLTSNGLQLNGTIAQIFEKDAPSTLPHLEMYSGTATASYNSSTKTLSITSSGGVIKYVNKPFSDNKTELAKCQRYYEKIDDFRIYMGSRNPWSLASEVVGLFPFKVTKANIPVVTFEYEKSSNGGVWIPVTASHSYSYGFTDYSAVFNCDYVSFRNVIANANL